MTETTRSPAMELGLALLVGLALTVPLFAVWLIVYDRERQTSRPTAPPARPGGRPTDRSRPGSA